MVKVMMSVEIDDEMEDLIKALNALDLTTTSCCAGHHDNKGDNDMDEAHIAICMENITGVGFYTEEGRKELIIHWKRDFEDEADKEDD